MGTPDVRVLSVSMVADDGVWLSALSLPESWKLESCAGVQSTLAAIAQKDVAVVLCDCDADTNAWRVLLAECHGLPYAPCIIVTSRLADERLWAEALNLGAYDVLAKPFDSREVLHAVNHAVEHWSRLAPMPLETALGNKAGSAAA